MADQQNSRPQSGFLKNLVKKICRIMNYDFKKLVEFSGDRLGKDKFYKLDSKNIIKVLNKSEQINMKSFGLLGYDGGEAIKIVDDFIHFNKDLSLRNNLFSFSMSSNEGKRFLQGCYIEYDSTDSKLRHLQRKFNIN